MELVVKERANWTIIAKGSESKTVRVFEGNWYYAPEAVQMEPKYDASCSSSYSKSSISLSP